MPVNTTGRSAAVYLPAYGNQVVRALTADSRAAFASVSAWLEHDRNVPDAAEARSVHPNTLRYRLGRVRETTGLDLTDPGALLLTALLLRRSVT